MLPFFLALAHRMGTREEHLTEFARGRLSSEAKQIMDALGESSPQETKGLRLCVMGRSRSFAAKFEKAMHELQTKMFIVNVADEYDPTAFQWAPLYKKFPKELRRARKTSLDEAREQVLGKYFECQYVSSVRDVQRTLGWKKQVIFRTLGSLMQKGMIAPKVRVDGNNGKFYASTA